MHVCVCVCAKMGGGIALIYSCLGEFQQCCQARRHVGAKKSQESQHCESILLAVAGNDWGVCGIPHGQTSSESMGSQKSWMPGLQIFLGLSPSVQF